jgi:hypothetical protein
MKKNFIPNHPAYDYYDAKLTNITNRSETQKGDVIFYQLELAFSATFFNH